MAAIFHLMAHGFTKGLLFLGSGSVIHSVDGEQDMDKMGGLRKKVPVTFATMAIAWIAISGIPPFAGFWSKDEILLGAVTWALEAPVPVDGWAGPWVGWFVFVVLSIAGAFMEAFVAATESSYAIGDPLDPSAGVVANLKRVARRVSHFNEPTVVVAEAQ